MLIIMWMLLIFSFSADNSYESTKKSDTVIIKISETILARELSNKEKIRYIDKFVVIVRKGAHFTVYLIFGLLLSNFIKDLTFNDKKNLLIAIGIAFLYAVCDEIHQLFVPGRSGRIVDVIIDTTGAFCGCLIFIFLEKIRRRLHEQKKAIS